MTDLCHSDKRNRGEGIKRREFIKDACLLTAGALGTLGVLATGTQPVVAGVAVPGKMTYRRLGRTGLDISVVISGEMDLLPMHERAYELGVNYWHKVGNFEHPGPEFFQDKDRDSFFCDLVVDTLDETGAIAQFEWGLKQSGLKMIDFLKIHSLYRDPEDIKEKTGILRAFETLKKQGKVRFLALAQHYRTAEICSACIESGLFDAIQPNFSVFSHRDMHEMIALAKKHDVGVITKKVLAGGERFWNRRPERKQQAEELLGKTDLTLGQGLLKWALDVPGVTAVVPMITNFKHLEEDIAVGFEEKELPREIAEVNAKVLSQFAQDNSEDYCRSCGRCTQTCPQDIPAADIFRYELYSIAYGWTDRARGLYRSLDPGKRADNCLDCGSCESACPNRIPVRNKLKSAHWLLS